MTVRSHMIGRYFAMGTSSVFGCLWESFFKSIARSLPPWVEGVEYKMLLHLFEMRETSPTLLIFRSITANNSRCSPLTSKTKDIDILTVHNLRPAIKSMIDSWWKQCQEFHHRGLSPRIVTYSDTPTPPQTSRSLISSCISCWCPPEWSFPHQGGGMCLLLVTCSLLLLLLVLLLLSVVVAVFVRRRRRRRLLLLLLLLVVVVVAVAVVVVCSIRPNAGIKTSIITLALSNSKAEKQKANTKKQRQIRSKQKSNSEKQEKHESNSNEAKSQSYESKHSKSKCKESTKATSNAKIK